MTPSGHLRILGEVDQLGEATDDEIFSSIQDELDAAVAGEAGPRAPLRAARRSECQVEREPIEPLRVLDNGSN